MRGAHKEHVVHSCDAGRVEGQRLVERLRSLPSRMQGVQYAERGVRAGRREGVGRRQRTSGMQGERTRL
eukprot:scaffold94562_cov58-Phaeocystis_antarctica.AAC.5